MRAQQLWVVMALVLLVACGSKSPSAPSTPTARVELNGFAVAGRTWNNGHRYTLDFNLIERGGVGIVVDSLTADASANGVLLGSFSWDVTAAFVSNRILPNANRYANGMWFFLAGETHVTTVKFTVVWNDDNGHRGTTVATATVTGL